MKLPILRGLFLVAAGAVLGLAATNWWQPGLTLISSGAGPGQQSLAAGAALAATRGHDQSEPDGLLMLVGLVQGMRS